MAYTFTFGGVTTAQTPWLDSNFNAAGLLGTIPTVAVGTNTLILTPFTTPTIPTPPFVLQQQGRVSFFAAHTNTGAVTANVSGTGALNVYNDTPSGPTLLVGGEIVINNYCVLAYDVTLNGGAGGYHLQTNAASAAGTVTSVATGTGLTGGPITGAGTIAFSSIANQRLLANISGGSAAASANTLTGILDNIMSSTQGAILNRGASVWAASSETSYTPLLAFAGLTTGITYSTQAGSYLNIGYVTVVSVNLILTSKGSATGSATISLPATAGGGNRVGGGILVNYSNLTSLTTVPWLQIAPGNPNGSLLVAGSGTTTAVTDTNFANNSSLQCIFVYFTG